MKKNIFQIFCILLFFIGFGYFYGDEYWAYQEKQDEYISYQENIQRDSENFSLENISEVEQNMELHVLPDRDFLDDLVAQIDAAKEKIYVEVYIFTERDIRDALIRAHNRGIEVKILLENNPYQAPYLNDDHYEMFEEAWLDVKWSDPLNYSLNHAKLLIIDDTAYVSTGNLSYSLFTKNRDLMVSFQWGELLEKLEELFLLDYNEEIGWVIHPNLVLSPYNSRTKITKLIHGAQESVDFYFPYFADDIFQDELFSVSEKWITIRWIVESNFYEENSDVIQEFQKNSIELSYLKSPKIHTKAILVDQKYLYIGSINFSRYSFDENREIWVIISDREIILDFIELFESDL